MKSVNRTWLRKRFPEREWNHLDIAAALHCGALVSLGAGRWKIFEKKMRAMLARELLTAMGDEPPITIYVGPGEKIKTFAEAIREAAAAKSSFVINLAPGTIIRTAPIAAKKKGGAPSGSK